MDKDFTRLKHKSQNCLEILTNLDDFVAYKPEYKLLMEYRTEAFFVGHKREDSWHRSGILNLWGVLYYQLGDLELAEKAYHMSLEESQRYYEKSLTGISKKGLGLIARDQGNVVLARKYWEESLTLLEDREQIREITNWLRKLPRE